jgi:hypothetical protein
MHKLGSRELNVGDWEDEDVSPHTLRQLNEMGLAYRTKQRYTDDETSKTYEGLKLLRHMKHRLPEGFLQMATYTFSYETALNMYYDREKHRMPEWSGENGICAHLRSLPYLDQFIAAAAGQRG